MIQFLSREMRGAYEKHARLAQSSNMEDSHRLLLFYAVECGLKFIYMRRTMKIHTGQWSELESIQHNIKRLVKLLEAPKYDLPQVQVQIPEAGKRNFDSKHYHLMWRYGATCSQNGKLQKSLQRYLDWIKKTIKEKGY